MLTFLDFFFHFIHLTFILVNILGWMSLRTLWLNQISLSLTLISWLGFGWVYGLGYCFLTDWHWQVKQQLGERELPMSYVKLVVDRTFNLSVDAKIVDQWTMMILIISVCGCLFQSLRKMRLESR